MNAKLYLDAHCKGCTEYIKALEFWCSLSNYELDILMIDDNPVDTFKILRDFRKDGHKIELFPFLVIDRDSNISVHDGILTPDEVSNIIT